MLEVLLCLDSGLMEPLTLLQLPRRVAGVIPISEIVGDDTIELGEETLPKSLCVEW